IVTNTHNSNSNILNKAIRCTTNPNAVDKQGGSTTRLAQIPLCRPVYRRYSLLHRQLSKIPASLLCATRTTRNSAVTTHQRTQTQLPHQRHSLDSGRMLL